MRWCLGSKARRGIRCFSYRASFGATRPGRVAEAGGARRSEWLRMRRIRCRRPPGRAWRRRRSEREQEREWEEEEEEEEEREEVL